MNYDDDDDHHDDDGLIFILYYSMCGPVDWFGTCSLAPGPRYQQQQPQLTGPGGSWAGIVASLWGLGC